MAQSEPVLPNSIRFTWLERLGNAAADLLFPPHCVACNGFGAWLCARCVDEIAVIHPPFCHRCGLPVAATATPQIAGQTALMPESPTPSWDIRWICQTCRESATGLDGMRAYALHEDPLRKAIAVFKYQGLRALAVSLGELMSQGWASLAPADRSMDVIVPVPLHRTRYRERGFNQAALLSWHLGACIQRPVVEDALLRTKATSPQVGLGPEERRENVDGAFQCITDSLAGKCVLLVDDVYTTGSTLEAACSALRGAGVRSVWAYTLARAGSHQTGNVRNYEKEAGPWN